MRKLVIGTWNLRHGGGVRTEKILCSIKVNNKVDVWVLTEYRNNQNREIFEQGLKKQGYLYFQSINVEPKLNSVLIASKIEFKSKTFPNLKEHEQRIIKIEIEKYTIYGCYFPNMNIKKVIFDFLMSEIEKYGTNNLIFTGDFNTGKHYLDEKGATFLHANFLDLFEKVGLIDAWREIHKVKKEFSWFSHIGNGFRLDHFFIDKNLTDKIIDCEYIHKYREEKISDHSMMILELGCK